MKKSFVLGVLAASLALAACNQQGGAANAASGAATQSAGASAPAAGLETESKQLGYMMGYQLASQLQLDTLKKNGVELDTGALVEAINDQISAKPSKLSPEQAQTVLNSISQKMQAAAAAAASEANAAGNKFLSENSKKDGVKVTASGLQYKVNKEGTGAQIAKGDVASVEYEGKLTNGEVFDGNKGGQDFAVPVIDGAVIQGWIEGLQLMKEGGEYTLYIPAKLAYGEQSPSPKIPANSVLVFDIKVKKVEKDGAKKMMQQAQQAAQDEAKAAQEAAKANH